MGMFVSIIALTIVWFFMEALYTECFLYIKRWYAAIPIILYIASIMNDGLGTSYLGGPSIDLLAIMVGEQKSSFK